MEIWLVRHTTPKIGKGIAYGQADLDVTEDYTTERDRIKELLEGTIEAQTPYLYQPAETLSDTGAGFGAATGQPANHR